MSGYAHITYNDTEKLIDSSTPYAMLDVREAGEYAASHVLAAANAPLSRLEILAFDLIPNRTVPIILMDNGDDDTRATRAATVLSGMGFTTPLVLKGGTRLWQESGGTLVNGLFCLPKGFAEAMEHARQTPLIRPEEAMARLAGGENVTVIDVRAPGELQALTLENAVNAPGCEAMYGFADIAPDPKTTVVVTCAARARGVIWAQALIDSGVPNPVFALMGGTMNWEKAGGLLAPAARPVGQASDSARRAAARRAEILQRKFALSFVSPAELAKWQASDFPLYVYDVRTEAEFAVRHLIGSRNVPGGELVLRVEQFGTMRHAHMVLVDDDGGARATVTASILHQMGLESVHILSGGLAAAPAEMWTNEPSPAAIFTTPGEPVTAKELATELDGKSPPLVIDVGASHRYRTGHVPSSFWAPRVYIDRIRHAYPDARRVVLVSDDKRHACLAAKDSMALWPCASVRYLEGGTRAWEIAGFLLAQGMEGAFCDPIDTMPQPGNDPQEKAKAMEAYFDWDNTLARKIREDGNMTFLWP